MADANLGRLVATLEARADKFNQSLTLAEKRLDSLGRKADASTDQVKRSFGRLDSLGASLVKGFAAIGVALGAGAAALGVFAKRQLDALDRLGDLSQQTGIAATALRQLQVGLELSGGTAEQAGEGMLTFARNLGQVEAGTGRLTGLLKKLDPAFLETLKNAGGTEEALRLVADRIAVASSEQEKLAIATAAFGPAGRQFVLLLKDGAAGLDTMRSELEALGIGDLDALTAAAQRFDDQIKKASAAITTQFTKGLFGVGDGLDHLTEALDDEAVKNLGEFAKYMGQLAGAIAAVSITQLESIAAVIAAIRRGESLGAAVQSGLVVEGSIDQLLAGLEETKQKVAKTRADLDRITALPASERAARAALPRLESDLAELTALEAKIKKELASRGFALALKPGETSVPVPEEPKPKLGIDLSGIDPAGPKGADAALDKARKAHDSFLREQQDFIAKLNATDDGVVTEAERLTLALNGRLDKIDEALRSGTIKTAEALEFRQAAIAETTEAITRAEQDALAAQAASVQAFIQGFGDSALNEAQQLSLKLAEAINKIAEEGRKAGLSPQQIGTKLGELTRAAQPSIDEAGQRGRETVTLDLLKREAATESESLFGLSDSLQAEIEKAEAIAEASELDEKIERAFAGDPAKIAELQQRNADQLSDHLADIESSWDENLHEIGEFGEQVFGDMVEGWVQGAEVSFDGILKSFLVMLVKMEAEAIAADIAGAITGKGGKQKQSLTGAAVSALWALAFAEGGAVKPGGYVESLETFERHFETKLAAGGLLRPDGRIERIEALADGGAATSGTVRALTGEAGTERILKMSQVPEIFRKSGGDPKRAAELAKKAGKTVSQPTLIDLVPGDVVIPDRKLEGFFGKLSLPKMAEGGAITPLGGVSIEVGSEVNVEIINASGVQLAEQSRTTKRSGRRFDMSITVGRAAAEDVQRGGELSRTLRQTGNFQRRTRAV